MQHRNRLILTVILMISAASTSSAFAKGELDAIYDRENAINVVGQSFHVFEMERKRIAESEKGIKSLIKAYVQNSSAWIEEYKKLATRLSTTKDLSVMQQDVSTTIRLQAARRAELNDQAAIIRSQLERSKAALRNAIAETNVEELNSYQAQITQAAVNLQNKLTKIQASVDGNVGNVNKVRDAFSFSFFFAKYLKAAIDQGLNEHAPQVAAYRSFLQGEIVAEQALAAIDAVVSKADRSMQRLEGQALTSHMPKLYQACKEARDSITASGLSAEESNRVSLEIAEICNKTTTDYKDTILGFSSGELARSMHNKNLSHRMLKKACDKTSKACDKWRSLQSITLESVSKLDLEGIRYLETQWQELRDLQEAKK